MSGYKANDYADLHDLCRDWLDVDYEDCDPETQDAAHEVFSALTYHDDATGERKWLWDLGGEVAQSLIDGFKDLHGFDRQPRAYEVTFRRQRLVSHTIIAKDDAEAHEIACKLAASDMFRARLDGEFRRAQEKDGFSILASDGAPTLPQEEVDRYVSGRVADRHATMGVTLQRWVNDYALAVDAIWFDCAPALDSLYGIDELPGCFEELRGDGWNFGDDLFHEAGRLGCCQTWDGPFEAYLGSDYQKYLGRRLISELGDLNKVVEWLSGRCDIDMRQAPDDEWPDWVVETYDAASHAADILQDGECR